MVHSFRRRRRYSLVFNCGPEKRREFRKLEIELHKLPELGVRCFCFVKPICTNTSQVPTRLKDALFPSRIVSYGLFNDS
jgi:hypothetical protein